MQSGKKFKKKITADSKHQLPFSFSCEAKEFFRRGKSGLTFLKTTWLWNETKKWLFTAHFVTQLRS